MKRDIKNTNYLYFLGGFAEGEGSNSVSITNPPPYLHTATYVGGGRVLKIKPITLKNWILHNFNLPPPKKIDFLLNKSNSPQRLDNRANTTTS